MKKLLYLLFLILFVQMAYSQQKPQYGTWNTVALRGGFRQITVQVSYKLTRCDPKTGLVGRSYFRTNNLKAWPGVFVSFKFDYQNCDGGISTQNVTVEVGTPGVQEDESATWFYGYKIVRPYYDVVIKDPVFDKALALKDQVDQLGVQLADKYNKVSLDLLKIKDANVRQQYLATITNIRGKIETAERDEQSAYLLRDGDKMAQLMDVMKQWGDRYDENDSLIQGIIAKQDAAATTASLNLTNDVKTTQQPAAQQQSAATAAAINNIQKQIAQANANTAALQQQNIQRQQALEEQRQQAIAQKTAGQDQLIDMGTQAVTGLIGLLANGKHQTADNSAFKNNSVPDLSQARADLSANKTQVISQLKNYMNLDRIKLLTATSPRAQLVAINNLIKKQERINKINQIWVMSDGSLSESLDINYELTDTNIRRAQMTRYDVGLTVNDIKVVEKSDLGLKYITFKTAMINGCIEMVGDVNKSLADFETVEKTNTRYRDFITKVRGAFDKDTKVVEAYYAIANQKESNNRDVNIGTIGLDQMGAIMNIGEIYFNWYTPAKPELLDKAYEQVSKAMKYYNDNLVSYRDHIPKSGANASEPVLYDAAFSKLVHNLIMVAVKMNTEKAYIAQDTVNNRTKILNDCLQIYHTMVGQ